MPTSPRKDNPEVGCQNCVLLRGVINDFAKQLMAFHKAGFNLTQQEIELAKTHVQGQQAEAQKALAEAERLRQINLGNRPNAPEKQVRHGEKGHTREILSE